MECRLALRNDNALDSPVAQKRNVEVYQEAGASPGDPELVLQRLFVDGKNGIDGDYIDKDDALYNEIVGSCDRDFEPLVGDAERRISLEYDLAHAELVSDARLVGIGT